VIWTVLQEPSSGAFGDACRTAMDSRVPAHAETCCAALDARWDIHVYPSDGGITVFGRDVTEQGRANAALRASEERLRIAVEAARLGIRDLDLVANTVVWISGAERIFGPDFVSCIPFEAFFAAIHPDDQPRVRAEWDRAVAGPGRDYEIEYRFRMDNGGWRWIRVYGRMVFQAGRPVRLVAAVQDISARKQAEADLVQAAVLLRAIGNSSADAIYAKDARGRFLYANPAVLAIVGKSAEIVIGDTCADWAADPRQAAAIMANDQRVIQTGQSEIVEEAYDTADLGTRFFRSAKSPLRLDDGTVIGIVGVSSDITPLKDAEAELRLMGAELEVRVRQEVAAREAAQMRAAHAERMQVLGQLAGGIAHDFNNVLQAVSGAMALIERRSDDPASIRRLARLAGDATERGAAITHRLLAFGRRGDLRAEAVDAARLLSDLREILVHTLGASIDVQLQVEAGIRPFIADKRQLETSLINLATNARDAMLRGGRLVLSAVTETVSRNAPEHPGGLGEGRYIRLGVSDTGTGMDQATLARAAEPFFTTKKDGVGTGLGLSMAEAFVKQSAGGLSVDSTLGHGTTVSLWLPEARVEPTRAERAAPQAAAVLTELATPVRVLMVDDEDSVREVLAIQLEDAGFTVLAVSSGVKALGLLAAGEAVDILVTDLSMPGMDGLALIRAAQECRRGLPALLLTGYAGDDTALALTGAVSGSFSLLRKPIRVVHLVERLRALLAAGPGDGRAAPDDGPVDEYGERCNTVD
jgi:PAS domain S-box-containing protein